MIELFLYPFRQQQDRSKNAEYTRFDEAGNGHHRNRELKAARHDHGRCGLPEGPNALPADEPANRNCH